MHSTDVLDLSAEPSALQGLTSEQQDRLTRVLDQYLSALADGVPPRAEDAVRGASGPGRAAARLPGPLAGSARIGGRVRQARRARRAAGPGRLLETRRDWATSS